MRCQHSDNGSGAVDAAWLRNQQTELHSDAWSRFERAVDVVAKSPPQHKTKSKKKKENKNKTNPTDTARRLIVYSLPIRLRQRPLINADLKSASIAFVLS